MQLAEKYIHDIAFRSRLHSFPVDVLVILNRQE